MLSTMQMLAIVCPLVFFASFVDSIAGGGGLISLPAYLLTGMPVHMAYGCNKFSGCIGTLVSAARYLRSGHLHLRTALCAAALALAGSGLGARLALVLSDRALRLSMLVLLPLAAVIVLFNKGRLGDQNTFDQHALGAAYLIAGLIGFGCGMYDGFFGPGTGTFMLLAFSLFLGFDFATANGNTKLANLASNVAALVVFISAGQVLYQIAIPAALCSICGNYLGSGLAIKKGAGFIRPMLIAVLCLLFVKIIYDTFF